MENMNGQIVNAATGEPMKMKNCHQVIDLRLCFDITMKLKTDTRQILRLD